MALIPGGSPSQFRIWHSELQLTYPHSFSLLGPPHISVTAVMNGIHTCVFFPSPVPPQLLQTDANNDGQCSPTTTSPSTPSAASTKCTHHGTNGGRQVLLGCTHLRISTSKVQVNIFFFFVLPPCWLRELAN
jgi:hypothetical protein